MKNILSAFVLILILSACAHNPPAARGLPERFLGYWPPMTYALQGQLGVHIHADGRLNHVSNTDGKVIGRFKYKFICAYDPDTVFIIVRGESSPPYFNYYELSRSMTTSGEDKGVAFFYISVLSKSLYAPSLKEWNNPLAACGSLKKSWAATPSLPEGESFGHYWRKPH